jgi:Amt family ammonium transporter
MQLTWLWGYLIPIGILLLAWGGLPPEKARRVTPLAALALALAVLGYWAVGYAFHLGGAHVISNDPALAGLDRLSGLDKVFGAGNATPPLWGYLGLAGFFLAGEQLTPTAFSLFLTYLPLVMTAVLLVMLALATDLRRALMVGTGALTAVLVFPIPACWVWGGGWLSRLGQSLELGHGFVDFGGSGLLLWLPAMMALGILLFQERRPPERELAPPPAHFPLLANAGALLAVLGWAGWALSNPLHMYGATVDWNRAAVSTLVGLAGAILTSQFYAWLVTGELEPLLAARGLVAGWGAVLAGAPFLPSWGALGLGLLAGLLFPLCLYLVEGVLRLRDATGIVALGLSGGLLGLLGTGVLADGLWGQGWNGLGPVAGGVAGLVPAGGLPADTGQFLAQLVGLVVLGLWGLLWGALIGVISHPPHLQLSRLRRPITAEEAVESTTPVNGNGESDAGDLR